MSAPYRDDQRKGDDRASALVLQSVSKTFGGLRAVNDVSFSRAGAVDLRPHRPERRRQDHGVQPDHRRLHVRPTGDRASSARRTSRPLQAAPDRAPSAWRARSRTSASSASSPSSRTCSSPARTRRQRATSLGAPPHAALLRGRGGDRASARELLASSSSTARPTSAPRPSRTATSAASRSRAR